MSQQSPRTATVITAGPARRRGRRSSGLRARPRAPPEPCATPRAGRPQLDESFEVELRLADGTPAFAHVDTAAPTVDLSITVTGSQGSAVFADFIHPQEDDRLIVSVDGTERVEALDRRSTYRHQLEAFVVAVREGRPFPTTTADSVTTMELIDGCSERAGLLPRGTGPAAPPG